MTEVKVLNLAWATNSQELIEFGACGGVVLSGEIKRNKHGKSKGWG